MVSSCLHLFSPILVGLLLLQSPRTTPSDATSQAWALLPSFIFNRYVLILGIWIQVLEFLSKARKHCRPAQAGREGSCLVSSSKTESRNMTQGFNCLGISLYHSSFLVALVTLLQTWGLQHRLPSLRVSWMPSNNFPWDFPQATVSWFAF